MEYVTDAVDHGKPVDVIYGLPKKAFDKVPHRRLLTIGNWSLNRQCLLGINRRSLLTKSLQST